MHRAHVSDRLGIGVDMHSDVHTDLATQIDQASSENLLNLPR